MSTGDFVQAKRILKVDTCLGNDVMLLVGLASQEGLSQLFRFRFTTIVEKSKKVAMDQLAGTRIKAELLTPDGKKRHFCGIVREVIENAGNSKFRKYDVEVVPEVWFLTHRFRSRIFQDKSVKEILGTVFRDIGSVEFELKKQYEKRNFCVQYRESDWDFAARLMEEEGIYFFFRHSDKGDDLVLGDSPETHPQVPFGNVITYSPSETPGQGENFLLQWQKAQSVASTNFRLWDHNFEKPGQNLEAEKKLNSEVKFGKVTHNLLSVNPDWLEVYDWPGGYARMFDGINSSGGEQPDRLNKIYTSNEKSASILAERAVTSSVRTEAAGSLRQIVPGHKFQLRSNSSEDSGVEGGYLITSAQHWATMGANYMSGEDATISHDCIFSCIPISVPFRPPASTRRPTIQGVQTATVVGPKGQEVHTDKYGRVKVRFHWDREEEKATSCWIRVAQPVAGNRWGASFWPRIGQEVVVTFMEGDPDRPLIIGSVYNPEQMPHYLGEGPDDKHKNDNLVSGIKTNSSLGGDGFNEIRFFDKKDSEQVFMHAQKDMDLRVKNDYRSEIERNEHILVKGDRTEQVEGNIVQRVGGGKGPNNYEMLIDGSQLIETGSDLHISVGNERHEKVATFAHTEAGQELHMKAGMVLCVESGQSLLIKSSGGFISIGPDGITIEGTMVKINCKGSPATQTKSARPKKPAKAKPAQTDDAKSGKKSKMT